jgi:hypothetical protein
VSAERLRTRAAPVVRGIVGLVEEGARQREARPPRLALGLSPRAAVLLPEPGPQRELAALVDERLALLERPDRLGRYARRVRPEARRRRVELRPRELDRRPAPGVVARAPPPDDAHATRRAPAECVEGGGEVAEALGAEEPLEEIEHGPLWSQA